MTGLRAFGEADPPPSDACHDFAQQLVT